MRELDSKGERPGEPCDPDCEWVSGRPHWNFKERLVFLDCSDGCLGSCLVILALPASECPLGASESGSVILGRLRTAAWQALDFQKAHQAFIKRSFSKGTCTVLPASVEICSGSWILDFRNTCLLWCYRLKIQDPRSRIQGPPPPPTHSRRVLGPGFWILDFGSEGKLAFFGMFWPEDPRSKIQDLAGEGRGGGDLASL